MSDSITVTNMPESGSREAVALGLTKLIMLQGTEKSGSRENVISLYVDCLKATLGDKLKTE